MADKKEAILWGTIVTISEEGLDNFSMKSIAKRAECSESLIMKYFKSRDCLIESAISSITLYGDGLLQKIASVQGEFNTYDEPNRKIMRIYIRHLTDNPEQTVFSYMVRSSRFYRFLDAIMRPGLSKLLDARHYTIKDAAQDKRVYHEYMLPFFDNVATIFAVRLINGTISDTDSTYDLAYDMIQKGLIGGIKL